MDDFSTPNTTNIYDIPASENNFIRPNKRPTSSMSPTIIVDKNNQVKLIIGASGGPRIISAITYVSFENDMKNTVLILNNNNLNLHFSDNFKASAYE